ncbi:MFS transporter [Myxococcaceae bacterium GXIMD 01537]
MGATMRMALPRDLMREQGWRRWVAAAFFARLPGTMAAFVLLLTGRWVTGSFTLGAWMASAYAVGAALAAPWRGRTLDRAHLLSGLRQGLLWQALLVFALAVAAALRAPAAVMLAASLLLGVVPSGVQGGFRALLSSVAPAAQVQTAFALDAVLVEVQWVVGPLLVGVLAAAGSPLLALGLMGASALVASALSLGLPERPAPPPRATGSEDAPVWRAPGVLGTLALVAVLGASWGAMEAGLPPRLEEMGQGSALWGVLAALLSAASVVGGLGHAVWARALGRDEGPGRARGLLLAWGVLLLPLAGMASVHGMALWLIAAGIFLAPLTGTLTFLLQRALPASRHAEGFSYYSACWSLGTAGGSALAGALLGSHGARPVLVGAAVVPLCFALLTAIAWRRAGRGTA